MSESKGVKAEENSEGYKVPCLRVELKKKEEEKKKCIMFSFPKPVPLDAAEGCQTAFLCWASLLTTREQALVGYQAKPGYSLAQGSLPSPFSATITCPITLK